MWPYADTTGGGRNNPFPNAHRYRDYVINSFNKDKPFDQFIMEQIAGDLMSSSTDEEYNEKLTGTGFLLLDLIITNFRTRNFCVWR